MQRQLQQWLAVMMLCITCLSPLASAEIAAPSGSYSVDPDHGSIRLVYNHLGYSRPSIRATGFAATLLLNADQLADSRVEFSMKPESLDSGVAKFNEDLRAEKFFNAAKFPTISFVSTNVKENTDGTLAITGDLTAKGVTRPVTLTAKLNKAGINPLKKAAAVGFSASSAIKRSEWGLGEFVPMVSDEVDIFIEIEFLQNK